MVCPMTSTSRETVFIIKKTTQVIASCPSFACVVRVYMSLGGDRLSCVACSPGGAAVVSLIGSVDQR